MAGWHHKLYGHEFEQAPGDGEGQGSLACCCPWGHKESDTTERLDPNNWQQELLRGDLGCCHILDPLNLYENVSLSCPLNGRRMDHKLAASFPTHS